MSTCMAGYDRWLASQVDDYYGDPPPPHNLDTFMRNKVWEIGDDQWYRHAGRGDARSWCVENENGMLLIQIMSFTCPVGREEQGLAWRVVAVGDDQYEDTLNSGWVEGLVLMDAMDAAFEEVGAW